MTMEETQERREKRLLDESACRRIADMVKAELPPGRVFLLVTAGTQENDNVSYCANTNREDAARLLIDLVDRWQSDGLNVGTPNVELAEFLRQQVWMIRESSRATEEFLVKTLVEHVNSLADGPAPEGMEGDLGSKALLIATEALALLDLVAHPIRKEDPAS